MVNEDNSNSKLIQSIHTVEQKIDAITNRPILFLCIIGVIGLLLRLHYFPYGIPLIRDALYNYFFYATDIIVLGHLPTTYTIANNGWPIFLSLFFAVFHFDNVLDYMTLQRMVTVSISILTIIPVYFLCKRFFDKPYAIIGAAIFAFEPRIIQNSLLGITEPLYIILITSALVFFFNSNKKMQYISFVIIAFSSIVRSEGLFVFFPMIIIFFLNHRKERKIIFKLSLAVAIFILILLPVAISRIQIEGKDDITSRITNPANEFLTISSHENTPTKLFSNSITHVENILKLSGWSFIPVFIFFVPIGFFLMCRKRNQEKTSIIIITIFMSFPVIYAFSFIPDTRYIYPLFPLFCIISIYAIKNLGDRIKIRNVFLILIICGILLSSSIFLDVKKIDYAHQRESFKIAQSIVKVASGVNDFEPDSSYLLPAELPQKWPALASSLSFKTSVLPTTGFNSLEKYINASKNKGLTHLVVINSLNTPHFLSDVFYHEDKYPYLVKAYDYSENNSTYHVKIYKIDYEHFGS